MRGSPGTTSHRSARTVRTGPARRFSRPGKLAIADAPAPNASYADVPGTLLASRNHKLYARALAEHIYRTAELTILRCPSLKMTAAPGASLSEFRAQIAQTVREKRDEAVATLRRKYAARLAALEERQRRAEQKVSREKRAGQQPDHVVGAERRWQPARGTARWPAALERIFTSGDCRAQRGPHRQGTDGCGSRRGRSGGASRAVCRAELGGGSRGCGTSKRHSILPPSKSYRCR